jgi:predicted DNA repair protein MutK
MILPLAFLLSAFAPGVVTIILCLTIYLAYEGAEKIHEYFPNHHSEQSRNYSSDRSGDLTTWKDKIKSAVVTDFILSVEINCIRDCLGKPILNQLL